LVLAVRTGEGAPGAELRQIASQSRVLALPPLSRDAVGKLAADGLGRAVNPAFAAACEEVTGGNPLARSSDAGQVTSWTQPAAVRASSVSAVFLANARVPGGPATAEIMP
jgi:hypothetical protein